MPDGKICFQYFFYILVPSGVGIFHADQFHLMGSADFLLLLVPFFYDLVLEMLFSVQLDHQNRKFAAAVPFIDHKIKPAGIEQIVSGRVVGKDLGYSHLFFH